MKIKGVEVKEIVMGVIELALGMGLLFAVPICITVGLIVNDFLKEKKTPEQQYNEAKEEWGELIDELDDHCVVYHLSGYDDRPKCRKMETRLLELEEYIEKYEEEQNARVRDGL